MDLQNDLNTLINQFAADIVFVEKVLENDVRKLSWFDRELKNAIENRNN